MKKKDFNRVLMQNILHHVDEGIHVINDQGKTMMYNDAMAELEGIEKQMILHKPLLEIFPSLDEETSTLMTVMKTGRPIMNRLQTYLNYKGEKITTVNTTIPLFDEGEKLGAIEIAKDMTKIKALSEQVMELQQELMSPQKDNYKVSISRYTFDNIVGNSEKLKASIERARRGSKTSSSVLIYGQTGTGKELFAQSMHYSGTRKNQPFIAQNCAALPETLLEGILFGTVKGGFTGAVDRPGLFEQANGGTLLLDEINSMGMSLQSKLLRALQEGYIRRVGGLKAIPVDVKIIATTNEHPKEAIEKGYLRRDLYYRLNVIFIEIPSLRERIEDLELLCDYFINKYNKKLDRNVWMISDEVKGLFRKYTWPGNVRELENIIEGAMNYTLEDEHVIKKEHIPSYVFDLNEQQASDGYMDNIQGNRALPEILEEIESKLIQQKLVESNCNISQAARRLKIKRQTLQHKIKKYNLSLECK